MTILLVFAAGVLVGLRSLTPPSVAAWFAHAGRLRLTGSLQWMGQMPVPWLLTVLALVELTADKLPRTPARTAPPGLIARIILGGLTGACVAMNAGTATLTGALVGIAGAISGTYGGYHARKTLVRALHKPDYTVAIVEDLICIGGSLLIFSRL